MLAKKNDQFIFSKNCHFYMGARNEKKLCQPKDITLKNTSAENEVDPKPFLGIDRF